MDKFLVKLWRDSWNGYVSISLKKKTENISEGISGGINDDEFEEESQEEFLDRLMEEFWIEYLE